MGRVDEAMTTIERRYFLPDDMKMHADEDIPLAIGHGQTNSQPYTVRRMLEWLDVQPGQKILDVGSGSGWTSALLAHLVGDTGAVHAVELIPELVKVGRDNCERVGVPNVTFYQAGETYGLPEQAPYDRILVSAGADDLPDELVSQLRPQGKLVIPIGSTIWEMTKNQAGDLAKVPHDGFMFVPLLKP